MMARLEEICAINMGQSPDSSTYNEDGNGLPFFQGNADFGEIYPAVRMWCSEPTKIAREKDILISVRAPIGALNIANCECCIGRGLAALTVNEDICAQEYLWHALSGKVDELMMKMQKWFQSTIFAVVLTYMIKLQLIQIAKLMFLQHQMRSRTVLSNWKANTQQLSQR